MFGAAKIVLKNGRTIDCIADTFTDDEYCSDEQVKAIVMDKSLCC